MEDAAILQADSPVWVEWFVDGWWYPAICEKISESTVFFRWQYSGKWDPKGSADISKVCRRIVTDEVPFALQTREAINAYSALALMNANEAGLFNQKKSRWFLLRDQDSDLYQEVGNTNRAAKLCKVWTKIGAGESETSDPNELTFVQPSSESSKTSILTRDVSVVFCHPIFVFREINNRKLIHAVLHRESVSGHFCCSQYSDFHLDSVAKLPLQKKLYSLFKVIQKVCMNFFATDRARQISQYNSSKLEIEKKRLLESRSYGFSRNSESVSGENSLEILAIIFRQTITKSPEYELGPPISKAMVVQNLDTACEILLEYLQEEIFVAFHLIATFCRDLIIKLTEQQRIDSSQLNEWEKEIFELQLVSASCLQSTPDKLHVEGELETLCKDILIFISDKRRTDIDGLHLLQLIVSQKVWSLQEDEKTFCDKANSRLSELHNLRLEVQKYYQSNKFNFKSTMEQILSIEEKILGARFGAQIEESILACWNTVTGDHNILHLRSLCLDACRNKDLSIGYGEVYKFSTKNASFYYILAGSNQRIWLGHICSQNFLQCIEPSESQTLPVLYCTLGTASEMGLENLQLEGDLKMKKNRFRTVDRIFARLRHAAEPVFQVLTSTGEAQPDWQSAIATCKASIELSAIFVVGISGSEKSQTRAISVCSNIDESKLRNILFKSPYQPTSDSMTEGCDSNFLGPWDQNVPSLEMSKRLHSPYDLWQVCLDNVLLDSVKRRDQAQASLDILSNTDKTSRDTIRINCRIDNFSKATMSAGFQRALEIIANSPRVSDEISNPGDCMDEGVDDAHSCVDSDRDDAQSCVDRSVSSPRRRHTGDLKRSPTKTGIRTRASSDISQHILIPNAVPNIQGQYYDMCCRKSLVRQIQYYNTTADEGGFLTFSVLTPPPTTEHVAFGLPYYIILAKVKGSDSDVFDLYSSCPCKTCRRKITKTTVIDFFNATLVLNLVDTSNSCLLLQFSVSTVLPQVKKFLGTYIDDMKVLDSACEMNYPVIPSMINVQNICLKIQTSSKSILEISQLVSYIPDKEQYGARKAVEVYSLLSQPKKNGEWEHSLIRRTTVVKRKLKELCAERGRDYTQLVCDRCKSCSVTCKGKACRHNNLVQKLIDMCTESESLAIQGLQGSIRENESYSSTTSDSEADQSLFIDDVDGIDEYSDQDNISGSEQARIEAKQAQKREGEYFDEKCLEQNMTGYVFSTLSSDQGVRIEFDSKYGNTADMRLILEAQSQWINPEFRHEGKGPYIVPQSVQFFPAPTKCPYCDSDQPADQDVSEQKSRKAKVFTSNCHVCILTVGYWDCRGCGRQVCYDGRDQQLWFHSPGLAVHRMIVWNCLKWYVSLVQPYFSKFVQMMDGMVATAMHFDSECNKFMSRSAFSLVWYSMLSTMGDFRFPCLICACERVGPPENLSFTALSAWRSTFPASVWDGPAYIMDAITRMGQSEKLIHPKECEYESVTDILDRCPIPTCELTDQGKYKRANATSSQRRQEAIEARNAIKSFGKKLCNDCEDFDTGIGQSDVTFLDIKHMSSLLCKMKLEAHFMPLIDVITSNKFPSVWHSATKQKFLYSAGTVLQCLGAIADVNTLLKHWVVGDIIKFCKRFLGQFGTGFESDNSKIESGPVSDPFAKMAVKIPDDASMSALEEMRNAVLQKIEPNTDSIPADISMFNLFSFVSFHTRADFINCYWVNHAVCSIMLYVAVRVCQVFSLQGLSIPDCRFTGLFDAIPESHVAAPVRKFRTFNSDEYVEGSYWTDGRDELGSQDLLKHNPLCGHVSYFTPTGNQLRSVRLIKKTARKESSDPHECKKQSYKTDQRKGTITGTDSLFLISCAFHKTPGSGGYHFIPNGAEGRVDAYKYFAAYKPYPCALQVYDTASSILGKQVSTYYNLRHETLCIVNHIWSSSSRVKLTVFLNMVRDSAFGSGTTFKLDEFHQKGHTCSSAFGADLQNTRFGGIKDQICPGMDTSAAEQINSKLALLRGSLSHMSNVRKHFTLQLVLFCWNIELLAEHLGL